MSQGLSPPAAPARHRASSTNLRPAHTLGRRRSASSLLDDARDVPHIPLDAPPDALHDSAPSMLVLVLSRLLIWLHVPPTHPPSSRRSSTDDFVLPLSTSQPDVIALHVPLEKPPMDAPVPAHLWHVPLPSIHAPILLVILLLPLSTAAVLFALHTLPITLAWPRTLADIARLGRELHAYSQSGSGPLAHVMAVMAVSAVWKHAWSVPGSVIWNVLAGALFSPAIATILLTALTTVGSVCASLLSTPLAPFLSYLFPRALDMTRNALGSDSEFDRTLDTQQRKSAPWVRLSILRLIGVVPWSGINIACGVCGVSITDCIMGTFIGCLPWTAVTCQIGDILQTVASAPSPTPQTISSLLASPAIIIKLALLSFLSLAPILGRDYLRAMISPGPLGVRVNGAQAHSRWTWVQDWRAKVRLGGKARARALRDGELHVLVQEKRALELLPS